MVLYAGEAVRVRAEVLDPDTGKALVLDEDDPVPVATVKLWGPGRNPARNPDVRSSPDYGPKGMSYRPDYRDYVIFILTRDPNPAIITTEDGVQLLTEEGDPLLMDGVESGSGEKWEPGKWSFRVEVTGNAFTNWEYGTFTLKA